ncbi:TPA: hypothetical protein DCX16_07000 [bacterium]|nr:hypothetical protein [bacterium]
MKNLLVIGGGRRGRGLLEILCNDRDINIIGIVDINENAPGIKFAKTINISTYREYVTLFDDKPIDIAIDVSGDPSVLLNVTRIKKEGTEVLGGLAARLISDILLERHDAHNLIAVQKKEIESILHGLGEGVLILDKNNNIYLINPVAQRFLGVKDEIKLSQKEHGAILEIIARTTELNVPVVEEIDYVKRKEGVETSKVFNVVATRIDDSEKNLFAIATILRDITAEKEIERLKNELIANVSHELRTPITSIVNSLYLMDTTFPSEKQVKFLDIIRKNTERLLRVINNLLDISRIEAGMLSLKMDIVNIPSLVDDVIFSVKGLAFSKKIKLDVDIKKGFPDIYGDKEGIAHVLINLLSNAVKFTPEEGNVVVSCREMDDDVHISVEDNGVGIPAEELDKIFNKFQRARTAANIEGTGLGLAIVKHFVNLHKGRIWVESEIGKGTKFTISLPKIDKYFHLSLDEEILHAKIEETYFSVIQLKLENYLKIKSEEEKQKILYNIEEKIKTEIHKTDRVIRYKDKGFFIILLKAGKKEAEKVTKRLEKFVDEDLFKDIPQKIYISYGIATFPEDGTDKETLLKKIETEFEDEENSSS